MLCEGSGSEGFPPQEGGKQERYTGQRVDQEGEVPVDIGQIARQAVARTRVRLLIAEL